MGNVTNTEEMFHGAIKMEATNKPRGSKAQTLA